MIARSSPPGVSRSPSSSSSGGCTSGGAPGPPPCRRPAPPASSQERFSPGCPGTGMRWGRSCLGRCTATRGQLSAPPPAKPNLVHGQRQFSGHGYGWCHRFVSRRRFERLPGLWTVKTGQPKIWAIDLRMLSLEDAPPVAMIRLGGFGMPNLSAWPRIDSI